MVKDKWLYLLDELLDRIDYYAWNIHDNPLLVYSTYANIEVYEAVLDFFDEEVAEEVATMNDEEYQELNKMYQEELERIVDNLVQWLKEEGIKDEELDN